MGLELLTGKERIILMPRCNRAILQVLRWAKQKYSDLYFPDQGGWITYEQYGRKLRYNLHELPTKRGLIDFSQVKDNSVVIFHDMPGYMYFQNSYDEEDFKKRNILVINDVTGSIGLRVPQGDVIVCSFGKTKMINLGYGGMIASNLDLPIEEEFDYSQRDVLSEKIGSIQERIDQVYNLKDQVLDSLSKFDIIQGEGPNVVIVHHVDDEAKKIIGFCERRKLEYKLCPMNIKILEPAISVEILRKTL